MLDVRCWFYSYRSASIGSTFAARRAGSQQATTATARSTIVIAAMALRSRAGSSGIAAASNRAVAECAADSEQRARQKQTQSAAKDQPQHVAFLCAQGHANADLPRALGDETGDDAIGADSGQHESEDCKPAKQRTDQSEIGEVSVHDFARAIEFIHR